MSISFSSAIRFQNPPVETARYLNRCRAAHFKTVHREGANPGHTVCTPLTHTNTMSEALTIYVYPTGAFAQIEESAFRPQGEASPPFRAGRLHFLMRHNFVVRCHGLQITCLVQQVDCHAKALGIVKSCKAHRNLNHARDQQVYDQYKP